MPTLKTVKWCLLVPFYFHISQKAAKSMAKLISQLCGELQPAVWLSRDMEAVEDHPSTHGCLTSFRTSHSKSSLGNFQYKHLPELLVNVYSYCLLELFLEICRTDSSSTWMCERHALCTYLPSKKEHLMSNW